jgi:uncharacterized protein (DUF849 family)
MASHKVIISVAGSMHTPPMSSNRPVTPAEIAESAFGAVASTNAQQVMPICNIIEGLKT